MIATSSLEAFANNGIVEDDLTPSINAIPPEKQQNFQQILSTPIELLSAAVPLIDYGALPDLAESRQFDVVKQSLMLDDRQRARTYPGKNLSHTPAMTRLILNVTNPNSEVVENFDQASENTTYRQGNENH